MSSNPNTTVFKQTWSDSYQVAHYKTPSYKAIADESIRPKLTKGQIYHRDYDSDFVVNDMGGDGSYVNQAWTDTDETLTVNYEKETSFFIKDLDAFQDNLPLQMRKAQKAMNAIFLRIDADVLSLAYQGAGSTIDDGSIAGISGSGITITTGNILAVFSAAEMALALQNVVYNPSAVFDGKFKRDTVDEMPVALISNQVYSVLQQYLGSKVTQLGDKVSNSGYVGSYLGFNLFRTNNLAWTGSWNMGTNPTDGDTFTLLTGVTQYGVSQSLTYTFKSTLGTSPVVQGEVKICSTAAKTITNLVNALNTPYTSIADTTDTGYSAWTNTSLTTAQRKLFLGIVATQVTPTSGTVMSLLLTGQGNVPVTQVMTAGGNIWTVAKQVQHNIFGVSKSISVVIQKTPNLDILQANPQSTSFSGRVGSDFVTWCAYGIKVFRDQSVKLIDVQVRTDAFVQAPANQA